MLFSSRFNEFPEERQKAGLNAAYEELLQKIRCRTVFMRAKTETGGDGILMAALGEEDVERVSELINDCTVIRFDCGHGIHTEKPKEFVRCSAAQTERPSLE